MSPILLDFTGQAGHEWTQGHDLVTMNYFSYRVCQIGYTYLAIIHVQSCRSLPEKQIILINNFLIQIIFMAKKCINEITHNATVFKQNLKTTTMKWINDL